MTYKPETMPETIDLMPHWPGVFQFAVQLCRDGLSEGDGRDLVVEMLEFGARLEAARATATQAIAKATGGQEEERHSDLSTIDLDHDLGLRDLTSPFGEED